MLSVTSGDLLVSEQPINAPAITSGSTAKQSLRTFMFLLWSGDGVLSICVGRPRQQTARTGHNLHLKDSSLNQAVDVEIFKSSGNEWYSCAVVRMRKFAGQSFGATTERRGKRPRMASKPVKLRRPSEGH